MSCGCVLAVYAGRPDTQTTHAHVLGTLPHLATPACGTHVSQQKTSQKPRFDVIRPTGSPYGVLAFPAAYARVCTSSVGRTLRH